jgi:hypothetical protein
MKNLSVEGKPRSVMMTNAMIDDDEPKTWK